MMMLIAEMREFAGFTPAEQRYIKRSLDIGLGRTDAHMRWARSEAEGLAIEQQYEDYRDLATLRAMVPTPSDLGDVALFLGKLVCLAGSDLAQERLRSFSAFCFLYERLLGARVRPFLPAAFCAASALPVVRPDRRKLLLQSLSEAAATASAWSEREPTFFPEYVDDFQTA